MYNNKSQLRTTLRKLASACQSATKGSNPCRASTGSSEVTLLAWALLDLSTVSWSPPNAIWVRVENMHQLSVTLLTSLHNIYTKNLKEGLWLHTQHCNISYCVEVLPIITGRYIGRLQGLKDLCDLFLHIFIFRNDPYWYLHKQFWIVTQWRFQLTLTCKTYVLCLTSMSTLLSVCAQYVEVYTLSVVLEMAGV